MSLVDVESWVTEHDSCERLGHVITAQLVERDRQKPLSTEYSNISANIRLRLRQFELELNELFLKLNTANKKKSITVEEVERRRRQLEILQSSFNHVQAKFLKSEGTSTSKMTEERNQLLGNKRSVWQGDDGDDDDDDEPIISNLPSNYSYKDFRQEQKSILESQNKGLEALSATISRQKQLSTRLGQEIGVQNDIIDNIAENMDGIDVRVISATRDIGSINQRDTTCCYWIIIIILFIAICVMALVF
ncbi:syntaxin-8 [Condylostylus longicornis]|uniref:syntaxin-8 n=1 Tax=Condylostylus longicornis TaxID=2530218 RepID=UPI00244DD200|nr:syntaxin-8 [Condylostylus longicornis]